MASATSRNPASRRLIVATGFMALVLGGCSNYIKRTEFDSTVAELRATDQQLYLPTDAAFEPAPPEPSIFMHRLVRFPATH